MKTFVFLSVLLLSSAVWGQTCQKNSGPLVVRVPQVGGTGVCDAGEETNNEGNPVTYTDTYHDTVVGDASSVSPGQVFLDQNAPPVSGIGACFYRPPNIDPKTGRIIDQQFALDCPPKSSNNITAATSTSDFNRFIAQIYYQTLVVGHFNGSLIVNGGECVPSPIFRQNLVQWPGIACKQVSGGCGPSCGDPCLNTATVTPTQGPTGSFTKGGGGGGDPLCSPIIIDTEGEGFHLTSADNGVMFDISGNGRPIRIAWTAPGSHNAFLALDRDGSGSITSGKELFGNFTAQPASGHPNGFLALAEFDKPANGGNDDGVIDAQDAVYPQLRLWIDANHDGICQPGELHKLPELGVFSLSVDYSESRREDQYGNEFRYRARVNPRHHDQRDDRHHSSEVGRTAYDVFFVTK